MSRTDPKHGRWILPLIIAALVVLTYTFIQTLEPSTAIDISTSSTTLITGSTDPDGSTTSSTTTTTLPQELVVLAAELDQIDSQLRGFADDIASTNTAWENDELEFGETRTRFRSTQEVIVQWVDEVSGLDVPSPGAQAHLDLILLAEELPEAVDDIVAGLEAPDDGTLRRDAVAAFADKVAGVAAAIDTVRAEAGLPTDGTTTTTSSTTTTTLAGTDG